MRITANGVAPGPIDTELLSELARTLEHQSADLSEDAYRVMLDDIDKAFEAARNWLTDPPSMAA